MQIEETIPASRKLGREDATAIAKSAKKLLVSKGKKLAEFEVGKKTSDEAIEAMLGPTGNLRAPTIRSGATVLVGFNNEQFEKVLL